MRSRRALPPLFACLLTFAACGTTGPTPPPTTPPTERPSPTPVPGPTEGPVVTVNLLAVNFAFNPKVLTVHAGARFQIRFRNGDAPGTVHDVEIRTVDSTGNGGVLASVPSTDGGTEFEYAYDALPIGDYVFICSIHPIPAMTGTLRVR